MWSIIVNISLGKEELGDVSGAAVRPSSMAAFSHPVHSVHPAPAPFGWFLICVSELSQ